MAYDSAAVVEQASGGRLLARKTEWVRPSIGRLNSLLRPKNRVEGSRREV